MPIFFESKSKTFRIDAGDSTYVVAVGPLGHLLHLYWGAKLRGGDFKALLPLSNRAFSPNPDPTDNSFSFDTLPAEYPTSGRSDFRSPAIEVTFADGSKAVDLFYRAHRIKAGKPKLKGWPATYVEKAAEADTLEIDLADTASKLKVTLVYSAYRKWNAIARSARIQNGGDAEIILRRALSASLDLPGQNYEMLQLSGAWTRERAIIRNPLPPGMRSIESRRGASSHAHNPFLALLDPHTTETQGEVRALSLVYSGNFIALAEADPYSTTRAQIGINPFEFQWTLGAGDSFQTPEAVMVYSANGLNAMSHQFHEIYRTRLCRGPWRDRERPILINNWEATAFDFTEAKLCRMARKAKEQGVEMFVVDDGWFGARNSDTSSLGDWTVNRAKLPDGLAGLARKIRKMGLKFGLWLEPEMVSPDSDLYRAHPDWCLHAPNRSRTVGRHQLVLDLSRPDVCDWIYETVAGLLASAPISYVKWDMNRNMTEVSSALHPSSRQGEVATRYILGLYGILEKLNRNFPQVLFESCSGGGGRFDPGMLHYMPQVWTSDSTDAGARLYIQYGTSLVYPAISMAAHVSASPNWQVKRPTSLKTRGDVASAFNFGYELDLNKLSAKELREVHAQIDFYRRHRKLIQFGTFHRLASPFEGNDAAWMVVSPDRREALVWNTQILGEPNGRQRVLKLAGLDPTANYRCSDNRKVYGGDFLQEAGLLVPLARQDFLSTRWHFRQV